MHSVVFNRIPKKLLTVDRFCSFHYFFFFFCSFESISLACSCCFLFQSHQNCLIVEFPLQHGCPSPPLLIYNAQKWTFILLSFRIFTERFLIFLLFVQREDPSMGGGCWRALDSSCGRNEREKGLMKRKSFYCDRKWHFGLAFFFYYENLNTTKIFRELTIIRGVCEENS